MLCSGFRFQPGKAGKSIPPSLSPFVTASSPLFGSKTCAKAAQFAQEWPSSRVSKDFVLRRVFRGTTASRGPCSERGSPARFRLVTRQPAELVTAFVTAPFFVQKALKTANSEKFVFSCQTASGMPEPQFRSFSVESRLIPLSA